MCALNSIFSTEILYLKKIKMRFFSFAYSKNTGTFKRDSKTHQTHQLHCCGKFETKKSCMTNVNVNVCVSFHHPAKCDSFRSIKFPLQMRSVDENLTYESVFLTAIARDFTIVFFNSLLFYCIRKIFAKCSADNSPFWF